jgi:hypothetical protein
MAGRAELADCERDGVRKPNTSRGRWTDTDAGGMDDDDDDAIAPTWTGNSCDHHKPVSI